MPPIIRSTLSLLAAATTLLAVPAQAATVLITGTNRGIGLEFVRQYAEAGWTVIGGDGAPIPLDELDDHSPNGVELEVHHGGQPSWWWLLAGQ